ncbi:substrate-binding domain-containing protein [Paracoccaceae bacterium GXU_MW_L88]
MATLKDVAKRAGLSVTQTSRALNDHSDVSAATRARVKDIARSLQYRPNLSARKLVSGRSGMVGLVVPPSQDFDSAGLFMEVVAGLSTEFAGREMQMVLHVAQAGEPMIPVYRKLIGNGALDGFVLVDPHEDDDRAKFLAGEDIPFVVHGRIGSEPHHPFFDIDNEGIFYELTAYLAALGHRRIALLNGVEGRTYVGARDRGYFRALEEAGIAPDPSLIFNGEMVEAHGMVSTVELFTPEKQAPTAIICGNVRVAKGVYEALAALGLSIPEDVSVVAHDDHLGDMKTAAFYPALTVTDAPLHDSWTPLAGCLADAISGADLKDLQIIGPHQFFTRGSCAAPRNS